MKHAIKDVAMHKKGLMQAAREYDVPVTTLKRIDGFMPYVWGWMRRMFQKRSTVTIVARHPETFCITRPMWNSQDKACIMYHIQRSIYLCYMN